jgi:hypothetical protein
MNPVLAAFLKVKLGLLVANFTGTDTSAFLVIFTVRVY